jgi:hypothetical protein
MQWHATTTMRQVAYSMSTGSFAGTHEADSSTYSCLLSIWTAHLGLSPRQRLL